MELLKTKGGVVVKDGEGKGTVARAAKKPLGEANREGVVLGVDHRELGQEVKAYVVPFDDTVVTTDELAAFVGETLAPHKVPAHWEIRTEPLPRNATGKILKQVVAGNAENTFIEE